MHRTKFALSQLLRQLALHNNRDYDKSTVAELSGISRTTITAITNNSSRRIDLETLEKLLDFFAAEGLPIGVGDLFTVTVEEDNHKDAIGYH